MGYTSESKNLSVYMADVFMVISGEIADQQQRDADKKASKKGK